jgi:predicted nucleotidyltransferase
MSNNPATAFGIPQDALEKIREVLAGCDAVQSASIYGSRARGTARSSSDIDIALEGPALGLQHLASIANALDDLLLPWKIDLCIVSQIEDEALLANIRQDGKTIYHNK